MRIQFQCDYNEGCAPEILDALARTNLEQHVGYGEDEYCAEARRLIREACKAPQADVHFLVGGTQANATVISSLLRPYQGVIAAHTGHIAVHETGAIEHIGHKVLALPATDGKITAAQIRACIEAHIAEDGPEHTVQPGMVYISYSTEFGTLYSLQEMSAIHDVCVEFGLPLFVDGARLGYGLASPASDITLPMLARLADVFYLGGTKQGALFGEAVVFTRPELSRNFRYCIKQGGGMLAKGRLLGIQFLTLMQDDLYLRLARHAVQEAIRIREVLQEKGYPEAVPSPTNQLFFTLPDTHLAQLAPHFLFSPWGKPDADHTTVRICTSWATLPENTDRLIAAIEALE